MESIDATPTWAGILPALLLVLDNGDNEGKKKVRLELTNMAKAADFAVELSKQCEAVITAHDNCWIDKRDEALIALKATLATTIKKVGSKIATEPFLRTTVVLGGREFSVKAFLSMEDANAHIAKNKDWAVILESGKYIYLADRHDKGRLVWPPEKGKVRKRG